MIVQAEVTTNSSEDKQMRVKIKSEGIWSDTPLIPSVGGLPLNKGNIVYVYCEGNDFSNPIIVGRAMNKSVTYKKSDNGSILWESVDGSNWSICYVMGSTIKISTSMGLEIKVDGGSVDIDAQSLTIKDSTVVKHSGFVNITGTIAAGLVADPTHEYAVTGELVIEGASYTLTK